MNIKHAALVAFSLSLVACNGKDKDDGGDDGLFSSWSGLWEQVACSDDSGAEVDCLVPITESNKRMIEFMDDDSADVWLKGTPENTTVTDIIDDELCFDVFGNELCYPIILVDGLLLYCLTGDLCEQLEEID